MTTSLWGLPAPDLEEATDAAETDLLAWRGSRLLVTGGTGFVGSWVTSTILHANQRLGLRLSLVAITRNPRSVLAGHPAVELIAADARCLPDVGNVDGVIAGAASSCALPDSPDAHADTIAETIVSGTIGALRTAARTRSRLLLLSSGAVYGRPADSVVETATSSLDPMRDGSAYGSAKRAAEALVASASAQGRIEGVVARLFSFVGPGLPTDAHFAAGNFVADALEGRAIRVRGDGTAVRSYMYPSDLAAWALGLLTRGTSGEAYNVGSPDAVTIAELAERTAAAVQPSPPVEISEPPRQDPVDAYVPGVGKAASLGLGCRVDLDDALRRTIAWHRARA